jgi:hypothetical protein
MSMKTHEDFETMQIGDIRRFPLKEAIAAFANDQSLGTIPLPPNFDGFFQKYASTHNFWFEGDLVIEKK